MVNTTQFLLGLLIVCVAASIAQASEPNSATPSLADEDGEWEERLVAQRSTSWDERLIDVQVGGTAFGHEDVDASDPPTQNDGCTAFHLSPVEAELYFSQARQIAEHDYVSVLPWDDCTAYGTAMASDGTALAWSINRFKAASVHYSDGRIAYLFCDTCDAAGFAPE